jgi:hypothetical protein
MRTNKYGVRGLKGVQLKNRFVYFWTPPVSLQKAGICERVGLAAAQSEFPAFIFGSQAPSDDAAP